MYDELAECLVKAKNVSIVSDGVQAPVKKIMVEETNTSYWNCESIKNRAKKTASLLKVLFDKSNENTLKLLKETKFKVDNWSRHPIWEIKVDGQSYRIIVLHVPEYYNPTVDVMVKIDIDYPHEYAGEIDLPHTKIVAGAQEN